MGQTVQQRTASPKRTASSSSQAPRQQTGPTSWINGQHQSVHQQQGHPTVSKVVHQQQSSPPQNRSDINVSIIAINGKPSAAISSIRTHQVQRAESRPAAPSKQLNQRAGSTTPGSTHSIRSAFKIRQQNPITSSHHSDRPIVRIFHLQRLMPKIIPKAFLFPKSQIQIHHANPSPWIDPAKAEQQPLWPPIRSRPASMAHRACKLRSGSFNPSHGISRNNNFNATQSWPQQKLKIHNRCISKIQIAGLSMTAGLKTASKHSSSRLCVATKYGKYRSMPAMRRANKAAWPRAEKAVSQHSASNTAKESSCPMCPLETR
ncbi:hypothetical protein ACLOJK_015007 [Asimina triloba]